MTGPALGLAAFGDHDLPHALARAAAAGFTAVDLQLDSTLPMTAAVDLTSEAGLARLRDQVAAEGLTAVCVSNVRDAELLLGPHGRHSDGVLVGSAQEKRAHAVRWSRWTVDAAVALGSPFARLYLGCPDHLLMFPWHGLADGWSENLEVLAASAAEVFGYARERGVTVCVEPHPRQAIFTLPSFQHASRLLAGDGHRLGMCLDPASGKPIDLEAQINYCRTERQGAPALPRESRELLAITTFVSHQSRGMPFEDVVAKDARLLPFLEAGRAAFERRQGQLNLACAQCHDENPGKHLVGNAIPEAHPTGYPLYRLEWQSIGSLQRRLRNCLIGVRAEPYEYGAPEYVEMQLYLTWRARGMPIETPAVRP